MDLGLFLLCHARVADMKTKSNRAGHIEQGDVE